MTEHDPFQHLSDVPGEAPSRSFVDQLETRLVEARTDVGPATPTDPYEIEGVVPMPEPLSTESPSRRWLFIAAAAVLAVVVAISVVLATSDDENPGPADDTDTEVGPDERDDAEEPPPAEDDPPVEESQLPSSLEVGESWLAAVQGGDVDGFAELHDGAATVNNSLSTWGVTGSSLADAETRDQYLASVATLNGELAASGATVAWEACTAEGDVVTCGWRQPLGPPGATATSNTTARLTVVDGFVTDVDLMFLPTPADLWDDYPEMQPYSSAAEAGCAQNRFAGPGCGAAQHASTTRYLQLFRPDLLGIEPGVGVAQAWADALAAGEREVFLALHAADAAIVGTTFSPSLPDGSLADPAVLAEYEGGVEATIAFGDEFGVDLAPACQAEGDGVVCRSEYPWLGDGTAPDQALTFALVITDGLIAGMESTVGWANPPDPFACTPEDGPRDCFNIDQFLNEILPPYQSCNQIGWGSAECALENAEFLVRQFEAWAPEHLVLRSELDYLRSEG